MTTIASTPWRVSEGTIDYGSFRVMANGGRLVAVVWSGASAKTMVTDMVAMAEANARLIAAAPNMLAALILADAVCEDAVFDAEQAKDVEDTIETRMSLAAAKLTLDAVRAAIAQARATSA